MKILFIFFLKNFIYMEGILVDRNTFFGPTPDDIKRLVATLIIEKLMPNRMPQLKNIENLKNDPSFKMLLYDNIDFWEFLWLKYVSSKMPYKTLDIPYEFENKKQKMVNKNLNQIRDSYIFAMRLYENNVNVDEITEKLRHNSTFKKSEDQENIINDMFKPKGIDYLNVINFFNYEKMANTCDLNKKLYMIIRGKLDLDIEKILTEEAKQQLKIKEIKDTAKIISLINDGADLNGKIDGYSMFVHSIINYHRFMDSYIPKLLISLGVDTSILHEENFVKDMLIRYNYRIIDMIIKLRKQLNPSREAFDDGVDYMKSLFNSNFSQNGLFHKMVENGMDISVIDENGNTPLHICIIFIYKNLLDHPKPYRNNYIFRDFMNSIKLLLKRNIDINIKNNDGLSAVELNNMILNIDDNASKFSQYHKDINNLLNPKKSWFSFF